MCPSDKPKGAALSLNSVLSDVLKETEPQKSVQATPDSLMTAYRRFMFWDHEILELADENFAVLVKESPETAIRLADEFGGWRLWIPASLSEDTYLQEALDAVDAQIVTGLFGNSFLDVPKLWPLRRAIYQRRAIVTLREDGWTRGQLAYAFRLSRKQINWILYNRDRRLALALRMTRVTRQAAKSPDDTNKPTEIWPHK